jgi:hypothetical protein
VLAQVLALGDENPVCLVVSFPTGSDVSSLAITAGLDAGVPVMLWCRDQRGAAQFDADIPPHIYTRPLAELPTIVLRLRRDALRHPRPADHVGRHISLLWDDPDRVPPPTALQAPTPA